MEIRVQQIFEEWGEKSGLIELQGDSEGKINRIAPYQNCQPGDLVFVPDKKALKKVLDQGVKAIVLPKNLVQDAALENTNLAILVSANIGYSHAMIKQRYGDHNYTKSGWDRIHPTAVIHESVEIPDNTIVGPYVVIERDVKVGDYCHFMANVVIEQDASIGNQVNIHPGTVIGWECVIGDACHILSNTVIGSEGFGYAQDQYFNHHRIPQTGNVIIGKKVTIGANNTIDRGTYGPTTIGDGCIFDNMCHVAHNVTMGKNCIILSGFLCAGSTTLGDRIVASGGAMIKDHVTICDDVYLMHRAGVDKDITEKGMYAGGPVLPMKEYVISNAIYSKLGELRKQVQELSKKVNGG